MNVKIILWRGSNVPLTRYVTLRVAHAPRMPGTFSAAADFKGNRQLTIPACITARAVMHVGIAYLRLWEKFSRRMRTHSFTYLARSPFPNAQRICNPTRIYSVASCYALRDLISVNVIGYLHDTHCVKRSYRTQNRQSFLSPSTWVGLLSFTRKQANIYVWIDTDYL